MADKEVIIKVSADTAKAKADVEDVKKAVEDLKREEETPPSTPPVEPFEDVKLQLQEAIKWIVTARRSFEKMKDGPAEVSYKVQDLMDKVRELGDPEMLNAFSELFSGQAEEVEALAVKYGDFKNKQYELENAAKEIAHSFKEGTVSIDEARAALERFAEQKRSLSAEGNDIARLTSIGGSGLAGAASMEKFSGAIELREELTRLQAEYDSLRSASAETFSALKEEINEYKVSLEGSQKSIDALVTKLMSLQVENNSLKEVFERLSRSTSGFSGAEMDLSNRMELSKRTTAELQEELKRLSDARIMAAEIYDVEEYTRLGVAIGHVNAALSEHKRAQAMADSLRYGAMNVRELRAEVEKLTGALRKASESGDRGTYERLAQSLQSARGALRSLTQEQNISKAAMMGQATAGMQLANQLNALAESAASGQVNVASMANQVISLGMAFKAGLGPIGWVMVALQGLQMVMQRVTEWDKKEAAAIAETEKMLKKKAEAMEALRLEEMKTANAIAKGQAEESARQAEAQGKAELERLKSENAAKQAERNRELQALRSSLKAETDLKKAAVLSGELSEDEFNAWQEGQNRKLAQAEKNNQLLANEERRAMVEKELAISQATLDEREKLYGKLSGKLDADQAALIAADDGSLKALLDRYDSLAKSQDERRTAIEELEEKLDNASHWYGDDADKEELEKQLDAAKDALRSVSSALVGVESELRSGFGKQMDLLQEVGISKEESLEANARILLSLKQELNETDKTRDQQIEKQRELQAQLSAIEEERKAIEQGVTERQREADAASTLRKAKEDKARAEEESKKRDAEAKKRDAEAKKQEAEYNREIASELSRISGQYKVTGSYKEEDNRSAKQIRDCDRTILEAKERELRDLLARTSDAATREKIQAALDDTEKAQRALADATRKAADQEAKRLKNMAPPELHSKNKQVDRNLQSLGKSYARYAKAAEKAAEAGDAKAMEKAQKRMQYYAGRMGRASKDQEKADRMYKKDAEALEAVAEEHGKDYQHVKRAGQDKRREEAAEARRNRRANQEAARQQRTQQQAAQPQQQPQPQVNAQEVAAKSQAAMQELAAQVAALTGACNGVAAAAEGAAKAAKNAVKTLNQKLKSLNEEVNAIREEVDA